MTKLEKNPKDKLSKEQKRAQALRDNLKKRKAQANLRKETDLLIFKNTKDQEDSKENKNN